MSAWKLRLDLATARVLVWTASVGRDVDLTSDTHLYFYDRYQRLADYHKKQGRKAKALRLEAIALEHYRLGGGDGPPFAAAMGAQRSGSAQARSPTATLTTRRKSPWL